MSDEQVNEAVEAAPEVENEVVEAQAEVAEESAAPESTEELQEAVEEAIDEGATKEEVAQMIKEFELKVNGKQIRKKIDLSDEEAVKRELQKALAGQQAMQEAAELKKLFAGEVQRMKEDPFGVLAELGLDPDQLAEARIQQKIEEMKKSPEQIVFEKTQQELAQLREKLQQEQEKARQAEMTRLENEAAIQLDEEIASALESHQSLPNSPYTVKKIADMMIWAMDQGMHDVSVADVIPSVERDIKREINTFMDELPAEMLEAYMGKQANERLRQKRLKAAKKVENASSVKKTATSAKKEEKREKISVEDWMRL